MKKVKRGKVLVAVLLTVCCMIPYLQPVPVMAKESFTGIGKIVEKYDKEHPYRILDIVPSTACYEIQMQEELGGMQAGTKCCFSTGMMAYLSDRLDTLTQDFLTAFENPGYYHRTDREALFHEVVSQNAIDGFPGIVYEEAYGGVHDDLLKEDGWSLLSDSNVEYDPGQTDAAELWEGTFRGTYRRIHPGEDPEGYDFILLDGASAGMPDPELYEYNAEGDWHVTFSPADNFETPDSLYAVESARVYDIGSYSRATGLYELDEEGIYHYAGTVDQIIYGQSGDYFDIVDEEGAENAVAYEDSGFDAAKLTSIDSVSSNTSDWDNSVSDNDCGDQDQEDDGNDEPVLNPDGKYYVVLFQAVDVPYAAEEIGYRIEQKEWIKGDMRPFDAYDATDQEVLEASESGEADSEDITGDISSFVYAGAGKGSYRLTPSVEEEGSLLEVINVPVYIRCRSLSDWLKQYVFYSLPGGENERASFAIEVETVRADEATSDLVGRADLICLESGANTVLSPSSAYGHLQISGQKDMDGGVVEEILGRAADELLPVIVDYDITTDQGPYKDTNYQYLAKALLKKDLASFYEFMVQEEDFMDNLRRNVDKTEDFPDKTDNGYNYVNKNVYVARGNAPFASADFYEPFDEEEAESGFDQVLAAIEAENSILAQEEQLTVSVSKAKALQSILCYDERSAGELDDLHILEIQPTANSSSDLHSSTDNRGNTSLCWQTKTMKTARRILSSRSSFILDTSVKSTAQFNGEREDINSAYNLVFIGLDGQKLNRSDDTFQSPAYNKEELSGKVYHTGDDSGVGAYDGNDITARKMADLLEYMEAGYPVLVEDNCFQGKTAKGVSEEEINTDYIDEETVMYQFLTRAVSEDRYKECIYTVSDAVSNPILTARLKAARPSLKLMEDNPEEGAKIQLLKPDGKGEYHGRIAYQAESGRGGGYPGSFTTHLYADWNYDGVFGPEEELDEYADDGQEITFDIRGMNSGILPWKLEIRDTDNPLRRDNIRGYFQLECPAVEELNVLQITEAAEDIRINLQDLYKKRDSMLAYYLRGAYDAARKSLKFETITPGELVRRLDRNDGYLNQWDVVVLTMDGITAIDEVVRAINRYIEEGRSLLVCSQNADGSRMGLDAALLGQSKENRTYASLGAGGATGYYRYAGLKPDMFKPQPSLKAESVNEGSITCYPYRMGEQPFYFGPESALAASDYLLECGIPKKEREISDRDISGDEGSCATVWYTLGGNEKDSAYGISPKDARNNYYCYSRNNVVWLGQAEYPYTYDTESGALPDGMPGSDECRFFVNALLAAYHAGVGSPDVAIVAGFSQDSVKLSSISVPFDQERQRESDNASGFLDPAADVYFRFTDSNPAGNQSREIRFYYENPDGEMLSLDEGTVYAAPFESSIWTMADRELVTVDKEDLKAGVIYRIQAPVVKLAGNDSGRNADIYVVLSTEFERGGQTFRRTGSGLVSLERTKLFLLE